MKLVGSPLKSIATGLMAPNPAPQVELAAFSPSVGTVSASAPVAVTRASRASITVARARAMRRILDPHTARITQRQSVRLSPRCPIRLLRVTTGPQRPGRR